ncbi:MAG: hypothetical protein OEV42_05185 [Deltaproteobacteria bacterium]|nr:hypothetical protein [Deltaproteobacteria bacterium]
MSENLSKNKYAFADRAELILIAILGEKKGKEAFRKIIYPFGGSLVYIPSETKLSKEERNKRIRSAFNGENYNELARKHGISARWVRKIIHKR